MERTYGIDDRIRRAEEIYARRQNLRDRTQRARVNISDSKPKNFKLFKRLTLQIIICILIYYIFYLISTTNYSFSENTLSKTKEILTYDYDFYSIYNLVIENINNFLFTEEENKNEEESNEKEQIEGNEEENKEDEESVNQEELGYTDISETDRIKNSYSFTLPVSGKVSSEYGEREVTSDIITSYHKGIDIAANLGTSILSSTEGDVIVSKYSKSYGNYIIVQNDEVKTVYAHCSKLLANVRRQG